MQIFSICGNRLINAVVNTAVDILLPGCDVSLIPGDDKTMVSKYGNSQGA